MGQGYTRQRKANISAGLLVKAEDINAELDAVQDFAHGTSGHSHDGTTGEGPKISLTTSISGILPTANGGSGGLHNLSAAAPPTVNDDINDNYVVGSKWFDTTADVIYFCIDNTLGNAKWVRMQPWDADLEAIGNLTSAANKLPYATGAQTWALADLSAFARTILDDADAAAVRSTIGTVIGTDVQAYNANLAAISGLTSAANKGIQFTGAGTASTYDLTAAGKALLDDADASAQLSTLGFSTFVKTLVDDADATAFRSSIGLVLGTDVQPYDAGLAALASFNTNGLLVQTADNTFAGRTLTGTTNEITVTNGAGTAGNPTISLPSSLTFTGKTVTGGTFSSVTASGTFSGTWSGSFTSSTATITGGTVSGITLSGLSAPLSIADGGTGQTTASGAFSAIKQDASTSVTGVTRFATASETNSGTADVAVTPSGLSSAMGWYTITYGASIAVNHLNGVNQKVTLGGNGAFAAPSNGRVGNVLNIWVVQDGSGGRVPTWNAVYDFGDYGTPSGSTTAGAADLYSFLCLASNKFAFLGIRLRVD